jgi:hypothetical protein
LTQKLRTDDHTVNDQHSEEKDGEDNLEKGKGWLSVH